MSKKRRLCDTDIIVKDVAGSSKKRKHDGCESNQEKILNSKKSTISITFGDAAENHVGMEQIGTVSMNGLSVTDLANAQKLFIDEFECKTELIELNDFLPSDDDALSYPEPEKAAILIVRDGVECILQKMQKSKQALYAEQAALPIDTKYFDRRRKRVLNKNARGNLCFAVNGSECDYERGRGTVIAFDAVPLTNYIREQLPIYFGDKARALVAEGNYYYDVAKCGIGFHGDAERKKVIALRLGQRMPLHYQWFYKHEAIGNRCELMLNEGDIYAMSEKATGYDWRRSSIVTLRHAAGANKFLTIKKKKKPQT
mmetsp:Transcript_22060/g.35423  ORF Transcript_22060/g.35423 Transcript_22060/m.35423 type:complete len:313 (+) Transcript_22060:32-970(+)